MYTNMSQKGICTDYFSNRVLMTTDDMTEYIVKQLV